MATQTGTSHHEELVRRVQYEEKATGMLTFAAVTLALAGAFNVIDGIVGLSKTTFFSPDAVYVFSDLRTWAWIVLGLGILQGLAALGITRGSQVARWFGIGVAALNAIAQLSFVQAYPFWALSVFALDILVIYALAAYGGRRPRVE
jgi:hypothetical protein